MTACMVISLLKNHVYIGLARTVYIRVLCTWRLTASMVNDADGLIYVRLTVKIVNYAVNRQSLVTVTPLSTIVTYGAIFEWRHMCTTLIYIQCIWPYVWRFLCLKNHVCIIHTCKCLALANQMYTSVYTVKPAGRSRAHGLIQRAYGPG